jgi:hypothetical protein
MEEKLVYEWGYERPRDLLEEDFWDRGYSSHKVALALDELSDFRSRLTHPDQGVRFAASQVAMDSLLHWKEIPEYLIEKGLRDTNPAIQKNWYEKSKTVWLSEQVLRHLIQHADPSIRSQLVDREDFQKMRSRENAPSPLSQLIDGLQAKAQQWFGSKKDVSVVRPQAKP